MKWKINGKKNKNPIPEVGGAWRHACSDTVYIRIDNDVARRENPNCDGQNYFGSISENGKVVMTFIDKDPNEKNRIILLDMSFTDRA